MSNVSRREFLKSLGAAALVALAGRRLPVFAASADAFEFLVVGDSLIFGQGLLEKDKIYTHVAEWLRTEAFGAPRNVRLKVKAHSGSTLKFHAEEAEKYRKAGRDEVFYYKPEVNVAFPSTWKQIEVAAAEYKGEGKPEGADLVMLSGCVTDITVAKVLDPDGDNTLLRQQAEKYCQHDMLDVLRHAAENNPNAVIAVVGYFPMLSPASKKSRIFNSWLESMGFPRLLKPIANNPITRKLYFERLGRRALKRSQIWNDESNKHLQIAVDRFNAAPAGGTRAVFIRSPLTEENAFEAPKTLLFRMGKGGRSDDPMYDERRADCRAALPELKRTTGIEYPVRYCEIAGVGHPNPQGARLYADAIESSIQSLLTQAAIK